MFKTKIIPLICTCLTFLYSISSFANSSPSGISPVLTNISLEQVTQDVSFLADDKLKGRGNFSSEITQAAHYIATRFNEIGLVPSQKNANYFQKYNVKQIIPTKLKLTINNQAIEAENIAFASTQKQISWTMANINNSEYPLNIHTIDKADNMGKIIRHLNQKGGQHLVLLDPSHKEMFTRYQSYFANGLTKLDSNGTSSAEGGSLLIVLTNNSFNKLNNFSFTGINTIKKTELMNVVAVLPGQSKKEEVVLYSAHYDHLGFKSATGSDDLIYNGADDDASGTAAIINLAQHFAKQKNNQRTLMFAAFSAEEIGGFGSRYFAQQVNPDAITAMINIEMIGKPSKFGAGEVWMTGMERSNLGAQLNAALAGSKIKIHKDPYPEQNLFYRSDNATLARLGVPAHSFSSTQLDKDQHYHQVSDNLASLDLMSLYQVINTLAVSTQPLIEGTITPTRIDPNLIKNKGKIY